MTACTAPRHGDDPPETEAHACLCKPCRLTMARDLRRLPGLHADLDAMLATSRGGGHGDGSGLPFNDSASECRAQIRHDVKWWAWEIGGERQLWPPFEPEPWQLAAWCGWLHGQVTWCTFRPWAADMAGALADARGRAVALLDPFVRKQFEIPGADGVCLACAAGRVQVTVYASDGDRRRSYIGCPACGERWEPEQWAHYGRAVIKRRAAAA